MQRRQRIVLAAACAYLGAVLAYWFALRVIGESWWLTTVALYLPHGLTLVPALPLVGLLAWLGPRKLAPVPVVAMLIVLFPIMGLVMCGGSVAPSGAPRLRLLSYNVDSARRTTAALAAQILEANPDVVVLQEGDPQIGEQATAGLVGFVRYGSGQFYIASRWPIVEVYEPPKIPFRGRDRTPRFLRYTLATPLGLLDVYNVHPISPRDGIEAIRGSGLRNEVESGGVFEFDRSSITNNTELRRAQARTITALARTSAHPVILAGDTNLPDGSGIFADTFGRYQDGFAEVGRGFGYTFPAHKRFAWMRIDRILAGPSLRFLSFEVGAHRASDHYCVWADLELRR